jgi:transcriptional regulator with XRE-family HTH domain
MAKRGDPGVLRFVVLWLRAFARWTQTQLAESCGAWQADVSNWEQGLEAPPEEKLRRMAAATGVPWFVVALLRRVFALALALAERFPGPGAARRPAGEPAALAAAPYLFEEETEEPEEPSPEQVRREAAEALAELKRLPGAERYRLIEAARLEGRRSEALAEQARRAGDQGEEEMAELAGFLTRQRSGKGA